MYKFKHDVRTWLLNLKGDYAVETASKTTQKIKAEFLIFDMMQLKIHIWLTS